MDKVKVGIFGLRRGNSYIDSLKENPLGEIAAVCDKDKEVLERIRKELTDANITNVGYYDNFDEFIQHDMDAVVMANYANEHAKYAIKVLESGRHVLSECLVSATLAEAVQLCETVERTGKIYSYAENYCYTAARMEMKKIYQRGDLGTLMYAEGEYLHDASAIWPSITYGERNHWRNQMPSTFYCTHAIGPILHMTGLRPVRVIGFESPNKPYMRKLGYSAGTLGGQTLVLENGAFLKTLQYNVKFAHHAHYQLDGDRGSVFEYGGVLDTYIEGPDDANTKGKRDSFFPEFQIKDATGAGHGGGDFFTVYYFLHNILGDEEAKKESIDVYTACDMSMPGILAYRSIVEGNTPQYVPNFRLKADRDKYRNDTFGTFPEKCGDMYVTNDLSGLPPIEDAVYDEVRRLYENHIPG